MEKFSGKSLVSLGEYYLYGLIDSRNRKALYIERGLEIGFLNMKGKVREVLRVRSKN